MLLETENMNLLCKKHESNYSDIGIYDLLNSLKYNIYQKYERSVCLWFFSFSFVQSIYLKCSIT